MPFTLCTSGSATAKAGDGVSSGALTNAQRLDDWSDQVEGRIIAETRRDWVGQYSSLTSGVKNALANATSAGIAKEMIAYDMSGYTSRQEALTMLNVQDATIAETIRFLKDFKSNEIKNPA